MNNKNVMFTFAIILILLLSAIGCNADIANTNNTYGDVDGNNAIEANDVALMLQKVLDNNYLLPLENALSGGYINILDVDRDGQLTALDGGMVLQKALNNSYVMPCETDSTTRESTTMEITTETTTETTTQDTYDIEIIVGDNIFNAVLYDTPSARALIEQLPMTVDMEELNGNEKYYYMANAMPTNTQSVNYINTGDMMLYGSNYVVLFYESFATSYRYTPLGKIDNPNGLATAVGSGNVVVTFREIVR